MIRKHSLKIIPLLFLLFILLPVKTESDYWKGSKYADLIVELKKADFSSGEIDSFFSDTRVKFYSGAVKKFKTAKVPRLADPKSPIMSEKSVNDGKEFIRENEELLKRVEKEYETEKIKKEVLVAILRIESYFGKKTGSYQAFGVLNSMIFYGEENLARSKWAKKEIAAFLIICRNLEVDPLEIKSSWAGAIGIPQFIPTSYLNFAIDGNKDGKIDLFNLEDALFSIANYLIEHDWQNSRTQALYSYNRSWNYVDGIEAYAKKLKE